ncbi:muscarinic acetylcholine receptor-like protein, partial [Dinothrombium tinctorium]
MRNNNKSWPYIEGKRTVPNDQCYIQFLETNSYITFATAIAAFYIPVTIMCILYWRIWRETEKRYKDLTTLFLVSTVGGQRNQTQQQEHKQKQKLKKEESSNVGSNFDSVDQQVSKVRTKSRASEWLRCFKHKTAATSTVSTTAISAKKSAAWTNNNENIVDNDPPQSITSSDLNSIRASESIYTILIQLDHDQSATIKMIEESNNAPAPSTSATA